MIYSAKERITRILFPTLFTGDMTVHGVVPPQQPLCSAFVDLRVFQMDTHFYISKIHFNVWLLKPSTKIN